MSSIWNSNVAIILGCWTSIIFYASFRSFSFNKSSIILAWVNAPPPPQFLSFAKLRSQPRLVLIEWVDPWWLPSVKIFEAACSYNYRLARSFSRRIWSFFRWSSEILHSKLAIQSACLVIRCSWSYRVFFEWSSYDLRTSIAGSKKFINEFYYCFWSGCV